MDRRRGGAIRRFAARGSQPLGRATCSSPLGEAPDPRTSRSRVSRDDGFAQFSLHATIVAAAMVAGCTERAPFELAPKRTDAGAPIGARPRDNDAIVPGMIQIPAGELLFGTAEGAVPRVAEEEAPAISRHVPAFEIDEFPFPNERGAMPRTGVSRAEASDACNAVGKRLCTATEWERACKGPAQATYPWSSSDGLFHGESCDLGHSLATKTPSGAAPRVLFSPIGDRKKCVAETGVRELAGGPWEWTSTPWNRGSEDATLGVLKGGNAVDGALVGRCANGLGRPHKLRYADAGFRCCRSSEEPTAEPAFLPPRSVLGLARLAPDTQKGLEAPLAAALGGPVAIPNVWRWTPVAGDSLVVASVCPASGANLCAIAVVHGDEVRLLEKTGRNAPGAVRDVDPAVLWVHPHAGPTVAVRILHYREGRILLERPENVSRPRPKSEVAPASSTEVPSAAP